MPALFIALFLLFVSEATLAFFTATIHAEGTVVYSPIMLFQGAPRSHYLSDHRLALSLADALGTLSGQLTLLAGIVVVAWLWTCAIRSRRTWSSKLLATVIGFELVAIAANVPFSAAAAFHHVGWGMPCNHDFLGWLLIANVYIGLIAIPWALAGAALAAVSAAFRWVHRPRASS